MAADSLGPRGRHSSGPANGLVCEVGTDSRIEKALPLSRAALEPSSRAFGRLLRNVALLTSQGYKVYAIRDCQNTFPMARRPIEVVPVSRVVLAGPPHGFNLLATADSTLIQRLGLRVVEDVSPKLLHLS